MLSGWIFDGMIINEIASETHKGKDGKLLTLEANEKTYID